MRIAVGPGTFGLAVLTANVYRLLPGKGGQLDLIPHDASEEALIGGLCAGSVDLCRVSATAAVKAYQHDSGFAVVASFDGRIPHVLVTQKDIRSATDLKGRLVGINMKGDYTHSYVLAGLRHQGLQPSDVVIVEAGKSADRQWKLRNGTLGATLVSQLPALCLRQEGFNWLVEMADVFPEYVNKVLLSRKTLNSLQLAWVLAGIIRGQRLAVETFDNGLLGSLVAEHPWLGEASRLLDQLRLCRDRSIIEPGPVNRTALRRVASEVLPLLSGEQVDALVDGVYWAEPIAVAEDLVNATSTGYSGSRL